MIGASRTKALSIKQEFTIVRGPLLRMAQADDYLDKKHECSERSSSRTLDKLANRTYLESAITVVIVPKNGVLENEDRLR